jgi:hypothetical protein
VGRATDISVRELIPQNPTKARENPMGIPMIKSKNNPAIPIIPMVWGSI